MSMRIDGSKVRFWALKREAIAAAKAIGWTAKEVSSVETRFCGGWAIWDWANQRHLGREEYKSMLEARLSEMSKDSSNMFHVYDGMRWEGACDTLTEACAMRDSLAGIGAIAKVFHACETCRISHDALVPCIEVRVPRDVQPFDAFYPKHCERQKGAS